jgi:hypothetical protein
MTKALTPVNQNSEGELDPVSHRDIGGMPTADFPSYFGNFGIFKLFLMFRGETRLSKGRLGKKHQFPLITAFMAIV